MRVETEEQIDQKLVQLSRRRILKALGSGAALAYVGFGMANSAKAQAGLTDADVLNFALNLEYLEAEFYSYAVSGNGISSSLFGGVGAAGATTGGRQVALTGNVLQTAQEIAADELAHVAFLRSALGGAAVAKPAINLNALGVGFGSQAEFLVLARAFEDVGVSAYGGAITLISNPTFLQAAAQIHATEAYHAGNIRYQNAVSGAPNVGVDGMDQPPTTNNFFATDVNALATARSAAQVAGIVRGANPAGGAFFPNGLNGNIR